MIEGHPRADVATGLFGCCILWVWTNVFTPAKVLSETGLSSLSQYSVELCLITCRKKEGNKEEKEKEKRDEGGKVKREKEKNREEGKKREGKKERKGKKREVEKREKREKERKKKES